MSDEDREWQFAQRQIAYQASVWWRARLTEVGVILGGGAIWAAFLL